MRGIHDVVRCVRKNAPLNRGLRPSHRSLYSTVTGFCEKKCPAKQGIETSKPPAPRWAMDHPSEKKCPAKQGIETRQQPLEPDARLVGEKKCPAKQGIETWITGRDWCDVAVYVRKNAPLNRGLRPCTPRLSRLAATAVRKNAPLNRGLRHISPAIHCHSAYWHQVRKNAPLNRGLRPLRRCQPDTHAVLRVRKNAPLNRGLRLNKIRPASDVVHPG